jgi:hypothetical protein
VVTIADIGTDSSSHATNKLDVAQNRGAYSGKSPSSPNSIAGVGSRLKQQRVDELFTSEYIVLSLGLIRPAQRWRALCRSIPPQYMRFRSVFTTIMRHVAMETAYETSVTNRAQIDVTSLGFHLRFNISQSAHRGSLYEQIMRVL